MNNTIHKSALIQEGKISSVTFLSFNTISQDLHKFKATNFNDVRISLNATTKHHMITFI